MAVSKNKALSSPDCTEVLSGNNPSSRGSHVQLSRPSGPRLLFLHHNQFLGVIITFLTMTSKTLIMMQKLEPKNGGLTPIKIGHVDNVLV